MKPFLLSLLFFSVLLSPALRAQKEPQKLKAVLTLEIPEETNGLVSKNGAGVAWHAAEKKYFTAMAGNTGFNLGLYSAAGKRVSPDSMETGFDVRGIWYNPQEKAVQVNGYNDFGWGSYSLYKGLPGTPNILFEGLHQPDVNSVGAYDPARKQVVFLNDNLDAEAYDYKTGESVRTLTLHLGARNDKAEEDDESFRNDVMANYNITTLVWTGIKGAEIGLLNVVNRQIELYNGLTGYLSRTLQLPEDAPAEALFNFAYANGYYWLFDKEKRAWIGFK